MSYSPFTLGYTCPARKLGIAPFKLPKKVSYEDWSGEPNHWVKPTHIFYFDINCKIAETIHKLNELIKRHYTQDKPVTFCPIERELLLRGERNIFNDYFKNFIRFPPGSLNLDPVTGKNTMPLCST